MTEIVRLQGDPPSPYELEFAFSRVVCAGLFVLVGGTTSVDIHGIVHGATPYEQACEVLRKLRHELERAGLGIRAGHPDARLRDRYLAGRGGRSCAR